MYGENVEEFMQLGLNIMDVKKQRQSIVFWTDIIRKEKNEEGLSYFPSQYMPIAYKILNGVHPPCFLPKSQEFLHLGASYKFGDYFVFEEYS